jgi:hypothetical protein
MMIFCGHLLDICNNEIFFKLKMIFMGNIYFGFLWQCLIGINLIMLFIVFLTIGDGFS